MGEAAGELFVTEEAGEILGTMMLREEQERNARSAPGSCRWRNRSS